MLKDFQTDKRFRDDYDCCVIGSGPAGITVALRLAAEGKRVVLVEGGDVEYSERSQLLYQCRSTGREAYVDTKRQRMLGGTSNHWAGRCRPMEPSDFSSSLPNGMSGWPISYLISPIPQPAHVVSQ
jgi:choline dehydrogenase-like flavoprotein